MMSITVPGAPVSAHLASSDPDRPIVVRAHARRRAMRTRTPRRHANPTLGALRQAYEAAREAWVAVSWRHMVSTPTGSLWDVPEYDACQRAARDLQVATLAARRARIAALIAETAALDARHA